MTYVSVRILGIPYSADRLYDYHVPVHQEKEIAPGRLVVVPFGGGNKPCTAFVEAVSDRTACKNTKPVLSVPGKYLYINPELAELCRFMSARLFCSMGDAVRCVLPAGLGVRKTYVYTVSPDGDAESVLATVNLAVSDVYSFVYDAGRASEKDIRAYAPTGGITAANTLVRLGLLKRETDYECVVNTQTERLAELLPENTAEDVKLTVKQKCAYEVLAEAQAPMTLSEVSSRAGVGISVVEELAKKGLIAIRRQEKDRSLSAFSSPDGTEHADFVLSGEQREAKEKLLALYRDEKPQAALLWGVTGSGKTNVLLKLIDEVLKDGRRVLVLVPEIALTSQTVGRFAARYRAEGIALIHSGLSAGERIDAWKRITAGNAKIVIGTRSAVFAPLDDIGLIIMDEEHDGSFKSDQSPRYHARMIAKYRCVYHKALLVMASATPSVESFYYAKNGKYALVTLKNRYGGAKLPSVELYDMRAEPMFRAPEDAFEPSDGGTDTDMDTDTDKNTEAAGVPFETGGLPEEGFAAGRRDAAKDAVPLLVGASLKKELAERLEKKEQSILLINRRGYRALALCRSCGYMFVCPNCSVSLTHHRLRSGAGRMVCHYCGYTEEVPAVCPGCGKSRISFVGSGTQLLEETLKKDFPAARILRMDADTTQGKGGHEKILKAFREKQADVLVGTQMVAKGHDFPAVTLVGVVLADTSLFVGDFRAGEKTFSLLTQVLGRAGRAEKPGHAVIQTYAPDNDVLTLASRQDYEAFYEKEIEFRRTSVFPPFCDMVTVSFASDVEADVLAAVKNFGKTLDETAKSEFSDVKFILYGPFRNEIYKLAGKYRMRYLIKCRDTARFREMLSSILHAQGKALKNVTVSADVNPLTI